VRPLLAALSAAVLATVLAACNGQDKASANPVTSAAFKDRVAAAIVTRTDLQADPGFGAKVDVSANDSLDTLSLSLEKPFAELKAHPERGDAIVGRLVQEAKKRMTEGNAKRSFADAGPHILPVLKPQALLRKLAEEPAVTSFPGHLVVAYGVQTTDSFTVVSKADLAHWQARVAQLHRLALANLVRETHRDQPLKCEEQLCGWASGDGYDAARMIVPELRREIVRKIGPAVYAVPRESVFVALPIKLAERIRSKVVRDFVTAPNPVSQDVFVERGGRLVVLPK
jgi:uncharacterized protein YtpQ (UPF0354 family)